MDIKGEERTDTEGILKDMVLGKAALCPLGGAGEDLGGYKGYGWATAVELLCTAFQSGPWGEEICGVDRATGEKKPMPLGHVFMAIDIEPLIGLDKFKANAGELLRGLRASTKDPNGPGKIWTAGEPEHDAFKRPDGPGRVLGAPGPAEAHGRAAGFKLSPEQQERFTPFPFEGRGTRANSLATAVVVYCFGREHRGHVGRGERPHHPASASASSTRPWASRRSYVCAGKLLEPSATCFDGLIWPVCTSHPTSASSRSRSSQSKIRPKAAARSTASPPAQSESTTTSSPASCGAPAARTGPPGGRARAAYPNTGRRPYRRRRSPLPCERPPLMMPARSLLRSRGARVVGTWRSRLSAIALVSR